MKLLNTSLLLLAVASTSALANDNNLYIGVNYLSSDYELDLGLTGTSPQSSDTAKGFNINLGYLYALNDKFDLAFEASINDYGSADINNIGGTKADTDVSSVVVSVKPTYYFGDSGFSLTGVLGFGSYTTDITFSSESSSLTAVGTESEFGISYGIEAAYQFTDTFGVVAGYQAAKIDYQDNVSLDLNTVSLGARFRF
ncbi:porin family protein [Grimontia kaedaensis]|uniref:Porin family protein n=1 Tax=Grimontia kaedaensis TaxID=2872157 RepID=A0ABY4WX70_9GAMM|nr:outer membrane beta-barrel protein [Grimontia kaedaensis]USH03580.1 porin family protein [Grimontia kaedaensis]